MKKYLIAAAALATLAGCVNDDSTEGTTVNIVSIDVPQQTVVKLYEGVYRFDAADYISQTLNTDNSNLSYVWGWHDASFVMANSTLNDGEIASEESYIEIDMSDPNEFTQYNNYYRLRVTDNNTDITYHADIGITVVKPFVGSWMVLHEQDGTKLGAVEFEKDGSNTVSTDIFADKGLPALSGNPLALGVFTDAPCISIPPFYKWPSPYSYENLFFLLTDDTDEAGNYCQWMGMRKTRTLQQMIENQSFVTSEKLRTVSMFYGSYYYLTYLMDGRLYKTKYALRTYEVKKNEQTIPGDYYLTHGIWFGRINVVYDNVGRRLLWYDPSANDWAKPIDSPIGWDDGIENTVKIEDIDRTANPFIAETGNASGQVNPIPTDREVAYIGAGPMLNNDESGFVVMLSAGDGSKTYVYQLSGSYDFYRTTNPTIRAIKIWDTPEGLTTGSVFASTHDYNGFLFYASGNKIYRFDYNTGSSRVIYEHRSGGTIDRLTFARYESTNTDYPDYKYPTTKSLGVVVNNGGTGEFVVLDLNESGAVINDAREQNVFTGFGKIKDVVFL